MTDILENIILILASAGASGFIGDRGWWRALLRFIVRRNARGNR